MPIVNKNLSDENEDESRDSSTNLVSLSSTLPEELVRSKTMPLSSASFNKKNSLGGLKVASSNSFIADRLKGAKEEAEKAIKVNFQKCS